MEIMTATHQTLHSELKKRILKGDITGKLPSIAILSRQYGVNHNTVKKVLDQLKMQSIIYGHQGKGVFVNNSHVNRQSQGSIVIYVTVEILQNHFYLQVLKHLKSELLDSNIGVDLITDGMIRTTVNYDAVLVFVENTLSGEKLQELCGKIEQENIILVNWVHAGFYSVAIDNRKGGELAISHLYENGHRRIGILAREQLPDSPFVERLKGALSMQSKYPDLELFTEVIPKNSSNDESMSEVLERFLTREKVSAIFAFTDEYALQLISLLQRKNLEIPRDISLIGYDNRDFSSLMNPPLTSIEEPAEKTAHLLAKQLAEICSGGDKRKSQTIVPELITRDSVKKTN